MEIDNNTGIADVVGGSSVFGTGAGAPFGGASGTGRAHLGLAPVVNGAGHVGADAFRSRLVADTRSFRRFAGATLPSRGSTRPEVVGLI